MADLWKRIVCWFIGHRVYVCPDITLAEHDGITVHEWQTTGEAVCTRCGCYLGPVGRGPLNEEV